MSVPAVDSVLDAVTVYASGAVCTRLAEVPADAAAAQVRVRGLPLCLASGSLRARVVEGPPGVRVLDVRPGFEVELPTESDLPAGQKALEAAEDALAALTTEQRCLDEDVARVSALQPRFPDRRRGDPPREASVDAVLALAELVDRQVAELQGKAFELRRRIEDATNEVELRRRRLAEASAARSGERVRVERAAVVTLAGAAGGERLRLAVEYVVPGARWSPAYELRLDRALAGGSLRLRANVAQRTGEDWTGVALSLSTADLARRVEIPELRSIRIGRAQPAPARSGWREPPAGLEDLFGAYDAASRAHGAAAGKHETAVLPPGPAPDEEELDMISPSLDVPAPPPARAMPAAIPAAAPVARRAVAPSVRFRRAERPQAPMPEIVMEDAGSSLAPQGEPEILPSDALLDHDRLALASLGEASRGRLVPRPAEWTPDVRVWARLSVNVDVAVLVSESRRRALEPQALPAPPSSRPLRDSAGAFDDRYDAAHRVDVESDGAWHTVPVLEAAASLAPTYVAVPAVEPHVFRTLLVHNRSPHAFLAGPADVTLGDEFLMTVPFPTLAPGGEERVGLGVEESIKVARNTRFEESTGGLLGGAAVLSHTVEIEVANRSSHPAPIEVRERVPVSSDKDAKVEETEVVPKWEADKEPQGGRLVEGARRWRLELGASQVAKLRARYEIRIPAGKMLVGGNRRA